ncbi:MAG: hypothetical protein ABH950_08710 [Candidatus Altiarchaeota archaeon]
MPVSPIADISVDQLLPVRSCTKKVGGEVPENIRFRGRGRLNLLDK